MYDGELYSKNAEPYRTGIGDYVYYKHRRYGGTLYTYMGIVTDIWFPDTINGSCRFITIKLLYSDDDSYDTEIGKETAINMSNVTSKDVFEIITKEQAIAKAL
jgi:hypothetical protein